METRCKSMHLLKSIPDGKSGWNALSLQHYVQMQPRYPRKSDPIVINGTMFPAKFQLI